MSQASAETPLLALFDIQRTAIRQTQQAVKQGLAVQRTANRVTLNSLMGQEALQRQGTEVLQAAIDGYLQSLEAVTGADVTSNQPRAIDEQFARLKQAQAEVYTTLEQELERGIDSFEELSVEYIETLDEQTAQALDTVDTMEEQTTENVDRLQQQVGEQLREGAALTQEMQTQLEDQFEQGTDQADDLLRRQAAQTEQFQQQLEARAESRLENIEGIGTTFADRLREHGIDTPADLAAVDVETVVEVADVSKAQAGDWIERAAR